MNIVHIMKNNIKIIFLLLLGGCDTGVLPLISDTKEQKVETFTFSGKKFTSNTVCRTSLLYDIGNITIDMSDYEEIDSIIFQIGLRTPLGNVEAHALLFNLTDSVFIENSLVKTFVPYQLNQLYSSNIKDALPNYPVRLTYCLFSSQEGVTVNSGDFTYIIVYYK